MGYEVTDLYFDNSEGAHRNGAIPPEWAHIDEDGLPKIGTMLRKGDPLYVFYNRRTKRHEAVANKKQDPVIVDLVIPIGQFETGTDVLRVNCVLVKLRVQGMEGEPETARSLYQRALDKGVEEARSRL